MASIASDAVGLYRGEFAHGMGPLLGLVLKVGETLYLRLPCLIALKAGTPDLLELVALALALKAALGSVVLKTDPTCLVGIGPLLRRSALGIGPKNPFDLEALALALRLLLGRWN